MNEAVRRVLREVGEHQAVDESFREGWHAALAAVRARLSREGAVTAQEAKHSVFEPRDMKATLERGEWTPERVGAIEATVRDGLADLTDGSTSKEEEK